MCMECLQTPCHPRCPNAVPEVATNCDLCGKEIYVGDDIYDLDGIYVCEDCIIRNKKTATKDDDYVL